MSPRVPISSGTSGYLPSSSTLHACVSSISISFFSYQAQTKPKFLCQDNTQLTNLQLPHLKRHNLHLHLRKIVPPQTSLHIPLRPPSRIQHHLPTSTDIHQHTPTLRLHGIRHLHPTHKIHVLRHPRNTESGQAKRRAQGRNESHDEEHRGLAVSR